MVDSERNREIGFVWQLAWESDEDAEAFPEACERGLQGPGNEAVGEATGWSKARNYPAPTTGPWTTRQ